MADPIKRPWGQWYTEYRMAGWNPKAAAQFADMELAAPDYPATFTSPADVLEAELAYLKDRAQLHRQAARGHMEEAERYEKLIERESAQPVAADSALRSRAELNSPALL